MTPDTGAQTDAQRTASYQAAGVPMPMSVSSTQTPSSPIQIAPAPTAPNYAGAVAGGQAQIDALNKSFADLRAQMTSPTPAAPASTDTSSILSQFKSMFAPPPSTTDQYQTDYAASGIDKMTADYNTKVGAVNTAQSKLDAINAKLQGLTAQATAIPIQDQANLDPGLVTKGGLAPQTSAELRNNALQAIPLQAQALAAQAELASAHGDATLSQTLLTQASDHLDKLFQMQTTDATNQYNYQKDLVTQAMTYADKQQSAALAAKATADTQAFTQQQDAIKNAQSLAQTAITNGQSDVAAKIAGLDPKSSTYATDLANLEGQIKQNPQDVAYKNAQIASLKASTYKTNLEAQAIAPQSPNDPSAIAALDPNSQSILAQTGLSVAAFNFLTTGTSALSRLSSADRQKIMKEAGNFLDTKGLDYATFQSQYKAYNQVVQTNIQRFANTQVASGEVSGSLDNLDTTGINGNVNWGNVAKVWAGQQVNDEKATNYAAQLSELRTSMAYFYAAQQGKASADIPDFTLAENTIKNGIANGGVAGLRTFIQNTTTKMTKVANQAIDVANKSVWDQFGVGSKYKSTITAGGSSSSGTIITAPDGQRIQITD